jgi:hypothetical protein
LKLKEKIFKKEIIEYFLKNYKAKVEIQDSTMHIDPIPGTYLS